MFKRFVVSTLLYTTALCLATSSALAAGPLRTQTLRFSSPNSTSGYVNATIDVAYQLIQCSGEVHVAYSVNTSSLSVSSDYVHGGKVAPAGVTPPKLTSVSLQGTVKRNNIVLAEFRDAVAGRALGMGCFEGQTKKVGLLKDLIPGANTPATIDAYLRTLEVSFAPLPVLRNSIAESAITASQRAQQAEIERARREAKAIEDAKGREVADRVKARELATNSTADAKRADQTTSVTVPARGMPSNGNVPPPNSAEKMQALERQGELARAELAERQRQERLASEQRAVEERERQQQFNQTTEALATSVGSALEEASDRAYARQAARLADEANAIKARLGDQCSKKMPWDKEGSQSWTRTPITLPFSVTRKLERTDCPYNNYWRVHNYGLDFDRPTMVSITLKRVSKSSSFDIFSWGVEEPVKLVSESMSGGLMGAKRASWRGTFSPGKYLVQVSNLYADSYGAYELSIVAE